MTEQILEEETIDRRKNGNMKKEPRKRKKRRPLAETVFLIVCLAYPLIQLAVFYFYVNLESFTLAFRKVDADLNFQWVGFDNFKQVFSDFFSKDSVLGLAFWNSIKLWGLTFVISTPLTMLFAFVIYKQYRGSKIFRGLVMLPSIISGMLLGLIFKKFVVSLPGDNFPAFLSDSGWIFPTIVFYCVWTGFAGGMIVYPNMMNGIDPSIRESAILEGCSALEELWYIVLPMILPTFTTYTVTSIAGLFTTAGPVFLLWAYDAPNEAFNMGYFIFAQSTRQGAATWYGYISALGLILSAISIPLTFGVKAILEKADPMNEK